MTDDLVKRLRFGVAIDEQGDVSWCSQEVMFNAANRIEKLKAALTHIYAWYPVSVSDPAQTIKDIREFARKALEGKDD